MRTVLSTHIELILLLLQHSLWQDVADDIMEFTQKHSVDWKQIMCFSDEQDITNIISNSLATFSIFLNLPKELSEKWDKTFQLNNNNILEIQQAFSPIIEICRNRQIPIIPFKETVYKSYYPHPLYTENKSTDILIPTNHLKTFEKALLSVGGVKKQLGNNTSYIYNNVSIETHTKTAVIASPSGQRYLSQLEKEQFIERYPATFNLGDVSFPTFNPAFNILQHTAHIGRLLIIGQLRLCHITDWATMLHRERTALGISEPKLIRHLEALHLTQLYRALGAIADRYFQLDADTHAGLNTLTPSDFNRGELIFQNIINGHLPNCPPYKHPSSNDALTSKIKAYLSLIRRCYILRGILPRECFCTPFVTLRNAIKSLLSQYKNKHSKP